MSMLTCDRCAQAFPTFSDNQAHGCATIRAKDGAYHAEYGSSYDGDCLVPTQHPLPEALSRLCDGCVGVLLETGQLKISFNMFETYTWAGPAQGAELDGEWVQISP